MKSIPVLSALAGVLALMMTAAPAQAQAPETWRVTGAISGRSFVLDCRLTTSGGTCTDDKKRTHQLSGVSVGNSQARWSFSTKVMLMSVTMAFTGQVQGERMSGTVTAAGRRPPRHLQRGQALDLLARVGGAVDVEQSRGIDLGVDLRRAKAGVA